MTRLAEPQERRQSSTALLFSLVALAVPVVGSVVVPDWVSGDAGLLLWILPITPAFLLSYYHGWRGASVALAAGMATLAVSQTALTLAGRSVPSPEVLLAMVTVLLMVALGSGWISEAFRASLHRARAEALTDAGTGLPNRRAVSSFLEKSFYAAKRGTNLCVVLFDLDHFKAVNDLRGHTVGDAVLREFAGILDGLTRAMNLSARWGGEEFVAVLNQSDAKGAVIFAERVREAVEQADLAAPGVTVSAGVAQYEPGMASPDVLLAAADQALYRAKTNGRNRVEALHLMGRRPDPVRRVPSTPVPGDTQGHGERILVVDDDQAALSGMVRALRRLGYSVLGAESAQRALQVMRGLDEPLDLVVSDIVMPDIRGFRLVEMMMEIQPRLRAVYVSGYSQEEVDWGGVPGDAWGFVGKPVTLDELGSAVAEVLARGSRDGAGAQRSRPAAPGRRPEPRGAAPAVQPSPALRPVVEGVDEAVMEARLAVLHPREDAASILMAILRGAGFVGLSWVPTPDRLLEGEGAWDLVVADLDEVGRSLPGMGRDGDGDAPPPAVLLLAGNHSQATRSELLASGLVEILQRPVDGLLLASTARNLLRMRHLRRRLESSGPDGEAALAARTAELQESRAEMLRRLARAAEYRDELTADHAERVGRLAGAIAARLGWSAERRGLIEEAAILHDVGKIAVPDSVLRKPDRLTEAERVLVRQHTVVGADLLAGSRNPVLAMAADIALSHHERWDGNGYPGGLAGEDIPQAGRIVAVADAFDTLVHMRPYQEPVDEDRAAEEILRGSGERYDPEVVEAFARLRASGELKEVLSGDLVARPDPTPSATGAADPVGRSAPRPE